MLAIWGAIILMGLGLDYTGNIGNIGIMEKKMETTI